MARNPTAGDGAPAEIPTPAQAAAANISPGEAAALMSATVLGLRQQWLQSAVTIANVLKAGQTVHRGAFEDLRRARENYEELERARLFLQGLEKAARQDAAGAGQSDDG